MASNLNPNLTCAAGAIHVAGPLAGAAVHDLAEQQRLRILRCTAQAMVSSPGGLRFKAGSRPWLDGLGGGLPGASGQRGPAPSSQRPVAPSA